MFASPSDSDDSSDDDEGIINNENVNGEIVSDIKHTSINGNIIINLKQNKLLGIAHQLWPAATLLCDYLEANMHTLYPNNTSNNMNILELGAGIGLCGIFLAKLGYANNVFITDLQEAQSLMNDNIILNNVQDKVYAGELCWGNPDHVHNIFNTHSKPTAIVDSTSSSSAQYAPTLVIASDCVYWEHLFEPLYNTVLLLTTVYNCDIIISHIKRWKKDTKFFNMCQRNGQMTVEKLIEKIDIINDIYDNTPKRHIHRIYKISKNK